MGRGSSHTSVGADCVAYSNNLYCCLTVIHGVLGRIKLVVVDGDLGRVRLLSWLLVLYETNPPLG